MEVISSSADRQVTVVNGFAWAAQALPPAQQAMVAQIILANALLSYKTEAHGELLTAFIAAVKDTLEKTFLANAEPAGHA